MLAFSCGLLEILQGMQSLAQRLNPLIEVIEVFLEQQRPQELQEQEMLRHRLQQQVQVNMYTELLLGPQEEQGLQHRPQLG